MATPSSQEDLADRIDKKRQQSTQEAGLLRWLQAKATNTSPTAPTAARDELPERAFFPARMSGKATTLRKALLAEGLDIVPDPLNLLPCPKVERLPRSPRSPR